LEADWCVGEFIKTLEKEGVLENTLIVFSSDNGAVLNDGYYDDAVEKLGDHKPAGPLRGGKYSLYEAGTRLPFITYWKGKIQPATSDALISHPLNYDQLIKPNSADQLKALGNKIAKAIHGETFNYDAVEREKRVREGR
jgi:hypothetical protein